MCICLPPFIFQLPLSSSHMNVYNSDLQMTPSVVGITSSSCPADLTQKRELTGNMAGCVASVYMPKWSG